MIAFTPRREKKTLHNAFLRTKLVLKLVLAASVSYWSACADRAAHTFVITNAAALSIIVLASGRWRTRLMKP